MVERNGGDSISKTKKYSLQLMEVEAMGIEYVYESEKFKALPRKQD